MAKEKKEYSAQPSFIGDKIYLRPETVDDAKRHLDWFLKSEPHSMTVHPLTFTNEADIIDRFKKPVKSPYKQAFAIIRKDDDLHIGKISFFNYNDVNRSAELGLLVDPACRKRGYGKEALQLLISFLFDFRNLNKVYAETAEFNTPTVQLLESLGFHKDGTLRQHHYFNGEYYGKFVYSLLRFEKDW